MRRQPVADRLWARVEKTPTCWNWTGGRSTVSKKPWHGVIEEGGRTLSVHRVAWTLLRGPIPPGLFVLHHCDNPICCNPDHLFLGTQVDNISDMDQKRRRVLKPFPRGASNQKTKLTAVDVAEIRHLRQSGLTLKAIAARYHVWFTTIDDIVRGRTWRHLVTPSCD